MPGRMKYLTIFRIDILNNIVPSTFDKISVLFLNIDKPTVLCFILCTQNNNLYNDVTIPTIKMSILRGKLVYEEVLIVVKIH